MSNNLFSAPKDNEAELYSETWRMTELPYLSPPVSLRADFGSPALARDRPTVVEGILQWRISVSGYSKKKNEKETALQSQFSIQLTPSVKS